MKLISWNVNGLRACMGKGFMDVIDREQPDAICLQETKMLREQADFQFPGYLEYWNSAEKKGYSGTAVFTKTEPISVAYGIGCEDYDREGRAITAEYGSFYLVTIYTPNSQRGLERLPFRMVFEDKLREYLYRLRDLYPDREEAYSWWSYRSNSGENNTGWRIDYFLCDKRLGKRIDDSRILPEYTGSDHCPVCLILGDDKDD